MNDQQASISDLRDEAADLLRRLERCNAPELAELADRLRGCADAVDAGEMDAAREAFYDLDPELLTKMLNGWTPAGPRPARSDLLATLDLASIQRVLCIDVTHRTVIPSHQWVLRDGSAPVRIEIQEGATLEDVIDALSWVAGTLRHVWEKAINPLGAAAVAKAYQAVDLRTETAAMAASRKGER